MSKTDEKNREKQEKLRELTERDRQLAVIRVSRVVKALDKSYVQGIVTMMVIVYNHTDRNDCNA